jgi:DNA repair protein SbcD/Mre11
LRLLAVGDLHLGRRPSRLTEAVTAVLPARELGPAAAWERVVKAAVEESVDTVALAGDVVQQEQDFFEAYSALQSGVSRLLEAGIRVLAVAGNHDMLVLPRLADELPEMTLLGREGAWDRVELAENGVEAVVWGWSFPRPRVTKSPLSSLTLQRDRRPTLGLLHADRDASASSYAPVRSTEVRAAGLDAWLLGHIHQPDLLTAMQPSGYLGSVTGLDPGELGARGPWLLEIGVSGIERVTHWPLAPLRWERLEVDLTGIAEEEEARHRVLAAIRALDHEVAANPFRPCAVGLRLRLVGRSTLGREVERCLRAADLETPREYTGSRILYWVSDLHQELVPEIDLPTLARGSDPVGLLARRLVILAGPRGAPQRQAFLAQALGPLEKAAREVGERELGEPALGESEVAEVLQRAGYDLLHRLLDQRGGSE